jgi:diguanylate cyclase (GGDEF)-like protein
MEPRERQASGYLWYAAALVGLAAAALLLLFVILSGDRFGTREIVSVVLGAAVIVGIVAAERGWRRDRSELREAEEHRDDERERLTSLESELARSRAELESREAELVESGERHAEELDERDAELRQERGLRQRLGHAREVERDWSRELREQIFRMQAERGSLADTSDVRGLILRLSLASLEAEKGLLLSAGEEDSEGRLELVAAEGFAHDPGASAIAQRFAREVLERGKTIREDDGRRAQEEGESASDEEIENLVAIPIYVHDQFSGVVVCANREGGFEDYDDEILLALGDHAGAVLENSRLHGELRASYLATVGILAEAIEAKDPILRGHSDDVSRYVVAMADRLGLEPKRREELTFASLLHDVGKIGISERILLKPGALSPEEYSTVQLHPRIGYRLLQQVPALRPVAPAVLHHHERFDGTGYPSRLKGTQIPLESRIIAVVDSFSAMTTNRPYRTAIPSEDACAELERCAGTQFDPEVVRIFVEEVRRDPPRQGEAKHDPLADPELAVRRKADEPVFGYGSLEVVDNLTLLYTRRHFHEVAAKEAARSEVQGHPFGVVLVELAGVSEVNRRDGYGAGDAIIKSAGAAVERAVVRCGGTGARHGGSRVGLVVPAAEEHDPAVLAAKLVEEIAPEAKARAGVAIWRLGETGNDVIARARASAAGGEDEPVAAGPTSAPPPRG